MSRKLIIGLHGLSNKPPEATLRDWWWKSITDGLYFFRCSDGRPPSERERDKILRKNDFLMVYWADIMYPHPWYIYSSTRPYVKVNSKPPPYKPRWFDSLRKWITEPFISQWDRGRSMFPGFGYDRLVNEFLKDQFQDLHAYWNKKVTKKFKFWQDDEWHEEEKEITDEEMRKEFRKILLDHQIAGGGVDILVIAHSMGSIIAFDTIAHPEFGLIDNDPITLITIGSPLGLPSVRSHLAKLPGRKRPTFPETRLKAWSNFADPADLIAAVPHLAPHFKDSQGRKRIKDYRVRNDFRDRDGKVNSHKSFGYLRCPEVAKIVHQFLIER